MRGPPQASWHNHTHGGGADDWQLVTSPIAFYSSSNSVKHLTIIKQDQLEDLARILTDNPEYLLGLKVVTDEIGRVHVRDCANKAGGKCTKWPSIKVRPWTCGICMDFMDKNLTEVVDAYY